MRILRLLFPDANIPGGPRPGAAGAAPPLLLCILLAACSPLDMAEPDRERLGCLGEDAPERCEALWTADIAGAAGLATPPVTAATPPVRAGKAARPPVRQVPAGTPVTGQPQAATAPPTDRTQICTSGGRAYGIGASMTRKIPGSYARVGMVNPRPGDGAQRTQRCSCQRTPGGGATWACF